MNTNQTQTPSGLDVTSCSPFRRRVSKCSECPYKDAKPSQRSRDELAYARCTPPQDFHCHMEGYSGGYGYGDGETMCRGHWEAYNAAVKRGIEADEEAGDRVHGAEYLPENAEWRQPEGEKNL